MYATVSDIENGEPVEIPVEDDNTILLSTLQSAFPGLTGLKYRAPSGAFRALKVVGQAVCAPDCNWESVRFVGVFPREVKSSVVATAAVANSESGPSASVSAAQLQQSVMPDIKPDDADIAQHAILASAAPAAALSSQEEDELLRYDGEPREDRDRADAEDRDRRMVKEQDGGVLRSSEHDFHATASATVAASNGEASSQSLPTGVCDLIVLGLSFRATEADLRQYFERFGELQLAEVKRDRRSEESRGFAFIRFRSAEAQARCLAEKEHLVLSRRCDVRLPFKEQEKDKFADYDYAHETEPPVPDGDKIVVNKLFVGRLPVEINEDDLRDHFGTYGKLSDCYIPKPFRAFAFVTFVDAADAQKAFDAGPAAHLVKGATLNVTFAAPKRAEEPVKPPPVVRDRFAPRPPRGGFGHAAGSAGPAFNQSRNQEPARNRGSSHANAAHTMHAAPAPQLHRSGSQPSHRNAGMFVTPRPRSPPSYPNGYTLAHRGSGSRDRFDRSRSSRDHQRSRGRSRSRSRTRSRSRSRSPSRHGQNYSHVLPAHGSGMMPTPVGGTFAQPSAAAGSGTSAQSDVSAASAYAAAAYEQAQRFYAYYNAVAQATAVSQQQQQQQQQQGSISQSSAGAAGTAFNNMMAQAAAASAVNPFNQFAGVNAMPSASNASSSSLPRGGVPPPPPPPASGWQHSQSGSGKGGWWGR